MNRQIQVFSIPAELKSLEEPSCLLPGESRREFEVIRQMIIEDVGPKTNLEWLWTMDLVELSWEILRYRRLERGYFTHIVPRRSHRFCKDWMELEYHRKPRAWCKLTVSGPRSNGAMIRKRHQK